MSSYKLVVKDAFWQILGRIISAIGGFLVVKIMTPYLGPLRYGDYSTILKYFAIWSAFADFGLYVIALKQLGGIKERMHLKQWEMPKEWEDKKELENYYGKFVMSRFVTITIVYITALVIAYLIPAYTDNPFLVRGLPLGMIFSASFMTAGILQLPLQLFWGMKHVSIALSLARIFQILVLVGIVWVYKNPDFAVANQASLTPFLLMIGSVLISATVQWLYVWKVSNRHIKLRLRSDRTFTWKIIKDNWQYGVAYCLSSLHTLGVMILLGIFFPTKDGFAYIGMRAVASALMEILLIVPSSLGNSIIHKVTAYSDELKRKSYGNLLIFVLWIGMIFVVNFWVFDSNIIYLVSGKDFLSQFVGGYGSDFILPWLAIAMLLSFAKQIYNFMFVSTGLNNHLLKVNAFGVVIGMIVGAIVIPKYGIMWGIVTQILMEVLYLLWSIFVAKWKRVSLSFSWKYFTLLIGTVVLIGGGARRTTNFIYPFEYNNYLHMIVRWVAINWLILLLGYKPLKKVMQGITHDGAEDIASVATTVGERD